MVSYSTFKQYIEDSYKETKGNNDIDIFKIIKSTIVDSISTSLAAVHNRTNQRNKTFEVLGYDFMIDNNYNCYMIECNRSPDLKKTTTTTALIVKEFFQSIAKIFTLFDYNELVYKPPKVLGKLKLLEFSN